MAEDLEQALDLWFVNLENPELTDKEKKVLKKKICPEWLPVSINDVDNVWCRSYIIEHKLLLLNIVKTAID
jgi:hypothetical protein